MAHNSVLLVIPAGAYLAAAVLYLWRVLRRQPAAGAWGLVAALVGAAAHGVLLAVRLVHEPQSIVASVADAASTVSFLTVVGFLTGRRLVGIEALGAAIMPLAFGALLVTALSRTGSQEVPDVLRSPWFYLHVTPSLLAYVAFVFSFGAAAVYLGEARLLRSKRFAAVFGAFPSLDQLENAMYRTAAFGFLLLTAGIATGAVWAQEAWGRYWMWTPKQSASLVIWLLFATYLHNRAIRGSRARSGAWLIVVGFVCAVLTFLAVSLLHHDPHRFL